MLFRVYSRKYGDVMAAYGRFLAPYRDSWVSMEKRAVVINLETIGDYSELRDAIGYPLNMDGDILEIEDAPADLEAYLRAHPPGRL